MRSLWRILALRWLGGDGSEALTGDAAILEGLLRGGDERPDDIIRRAPRAAGFSPSDDAVGSRAAIRPGNWPGRGFAPIGACPLFSLIQIKDGSPASRDAVGGLAPAAERIE